MSESLARLHQTEITVSGPDPLRLVESLIAALFSLTSDADNPDDVADAASIATFQAEATAIPELAQGIVDDVLATIADSLTNVAEIELANLLRTDDGWRAWGYVRFDDSARGVAPPRIVVEPSEAEAAGQIALRLLVTPGLPAATVANGASPSADTSTSNGTGP